MLRLRNAPGIPQRHEVLSALTAFARRASLLRPPSPDAEQKNARTKRALSY
jgi:hypothetical protein